MLKNGNAGAQDILFSVITYKPFGAVYNADGSDPVTFAGEMVDDTGLVYLFARYYDPELGRFYALDPELGSLSMPQTLNRYVYCVNSPLIHTDPTGRFLNFIAQIVVGAVVGATISAALTWASGGDTNAILAAAAGGAIGGAIAGATFGLGSGAGIGLSTMQVGAISGAVQGGGVEVGLKSGGDIGKILEGAVLGGALGAVTGAVGGATLGKVVAKTCIFKSLAKTTGNELASLNKNMRADAVRKPLMKESTAKLAGKNIGIAGQVSSQTLYNGIVKISFKQTAIEVNNSPMINNLRRAYAN